MNGLFILSLFAAATLFAQPPAVPGDAETWLDKGIDAYRAARYQDAIKAFQLATDLDPKDVKARLYLASAKMSLYIPGLASEENMAYADAAKIDFKHVLALDPSNITALLSLGTLSYMEATGEHGTDPAKVDEAHSWYQKALDADPRNKTALYSIGVIDWGKFHQTLDNARTSLGMTPSQPGPLPDAALRHSLQSQFGSVIEEGISNLRKAIEVDPRYDDAMAYLNLLLRERADLAESSVEYEKDIEEANQWVQRALDSKNARAEKAKAEPENVPPGRLKVPPGAQAERLATKVDPIYPPLARQTRIQGTVRFTAIIGKNGNILNVRLISGHPLLVAAAREAVQQWTYRPTEVDCQPVEVVTTIDVNFSLNN